MTMQTIYFFGECMVELRVAGQATMHQAFAGDVYNSAVYLKRCFPKLTSALVTAIGREYLSDKMLQTFNDEDLDTDLVFRHPSKAPGMYLVDTDAKGERSFTYWRNDSAAKTALEFFDDACLERLTQGNMFFFSGISLTVIKANTRAKFWQVLDEIKNAGVQIVFDPNYRARLWSDQKQAKDQFEKAFALADLALPGVEDLTTLYNIDNADDVGDFCQSLGVKEVVVKNGPHSVVTFHQEQRQRHDIQSVHNVVDTTSAGDAFNGVYLGARLNKHSVADAVKFAAHAAATVIQHPGAIAPKDAFAQSMLKVGLTTIE